MQSEDDLRALAKIATLLLAFGLICNLLNLYWFCYEWFESKGWTLAIFDRILRNLNEQSGFFTQPLYSKLAALLLLGCFCLGTRGVKSFSVSWSGILGFCAAGATLFFSNGWLLSLSCSPGIRTALYALTLFGGYLLLLTAGV